MASPVEELRDAVLALAERLRYDNVGVWRRCNREWFRRVRREDVSLGYLVREFRVLLGRCTFRRIARLLHPVFMRSRYVLMLVGDYILQARMEQLPILEEVMNEYREALGKYNFIMKNSIMMK